MAFSALFRQKAPTAAKAKAALPVAAPREDAC
jgi:hypothetical protein